MTLGSARAAATRLGCAFFVSQSLCIVSERLAFFRNVVPGLEKVVLDYMVYPPGFRTIAPQVR